MIDYPKEFEIGLTKCMVQVELVDDDSKETTIIGNGACRMPLSEDPDQMNFKTEIGNIEIQDMEIFMTSLACKFTFKLTKPSEEITDLLFNI